MSFNAQRVKAFGSYIVPLLSVTTGTITPSTTQLAPGDKHSIAPGSLYARISAAITTSSLQVAVGWQASDDGTNWENIFSAGGVQFPTTPVAAGTGTIVTTVWRQEFPSFDVSAFQYVRPVVLSSGATGAAGDNVTIKLGWVKRFFGSAQ